MTALNFINGPYSMGHMVKTLYTQSPSVITHIAPLISSFSGPKRIDLKTRLIIQLRMSQLMGCPVCKNIFPLVAKGSGFMKEEIKESLYGTPDGYLNQEARDVVLYVEDVLRAHGELPALSPATLPNYRCKQIQTSVRLEMIVHSIGLMFLPDHFIQDVRKATPRPAI